MLQTAGNEVTYPERLVGVVANSQAVLELIKPVISGSSATGLPSLAEYDVAAIGPTTDAILVSVDRAALDVIQSCDAVLIIVSAAEGIGTDLVNLWTFCQDLNIPLHLAITGLFEGYADFDETVAVARRIFQPDIQCPFLPMANDDASNLAGIFDLIAGEIWDYSTNERRIRGAEPEHLELTREERLLLLDSIAVLTLNETDLRTHQSGLQLPLEIYRRGLATNQLTMATPFEGHKGIEIILDWIANVPPRWFPDVLNLEEISHLPRRFGIGVTTGFARMWGPIELQLSILHSFANGATETEAIDVEHQSRCSSQNSRITSGSIIYSDDCAPHLIAPVF